MLVILGIGVLLNYLRELSNMGLNDFEVEFFSKKTINNVCCKHIIYGYYCVLNCINNKAKWDYTILRNYLCNYYSWASNEGVEICAAQDAQGQEQHHEPDQKNETVDTGDGQK